MIVSPCTQPIPQNPPRHVCLALEEFTILVKRRPLCYNDSIGGVMKPLAAGDLFEVLPWPRAQPRAGIFKSGDVGITTTAIRRPADQHSGGWYSVLINGRKTYVYSDEIRKVS